MQIGTHSLSEVLTSAHYPVGLQAGVHPFDRDPDWYSALLTGIQLGLCLFARDADRYFLQFMGMLYLCDAA